MCGAAGPRAPQTASTWSGLLGPGAWADPDRGGERGPSPVLSAAVDLLPVDLQARNFAAVTPGVTNGPAGESSATVALVSIVAAPVDMDLLPALLQAHDTLANQDSAGPSTITRSPGPPSEPPLPGRPWPRLWSHRRLWVDKRRKIC